MYMMMRRSQCASGRLSEVLAIGVPLVQSINSKFGVDFAVSINIGGDPDVIGLSGGFATLGEYQAYRAALAADADLGATTAEVGRLLNWSEDRIGRVLMPPGERADFSILNQARMHMPRIADAIPFGLEVAEFVEAKTGHKTGFVAAMTGDRSVVAWVGRVESLDVAAELNETLEADPEYLDLFKRSGDLFVDGSLEQTLWQKIA